QLSSRTRGCHENVRIEELKVLSNEYRSDRDVVNRRSRTTERPIIYREDDYYNYDEAPRPRATQQRRPEGPGYEQQRRAAGRPGPGPQGRPSARPGYAQQGRPAGRPAVNRDPYAPGPQPDARLRRPVQGYAQPGPAYEPPRSSGGNGGRNTPPRGRNTQPPRGRDNGSRGRNAQPPRGGKAPRRKNPFKSFIKTVFITLLVLLAIVLGLSFFMTKKAYSLMTYEEAGDLGDAKLTEDGVTNILLIGNDSRTNGEDGRSDAMIIVSISTRTGKVLMTSVLRDIYVEIPGYGSNRLNAAYAWGGPELLMKTIEQNFDIPVNRYVLVNFEAFANVVDAVGGIDLELTPDEVIWLNAYLNEYNELRGKEFGYDYIYQLEGGMLHLNGAQALAYSRNRYIGMDFGRTERQRKVMEEIIKKLPGTVIKDFGGFVEALCPNLTTNLTFTECYTLLLRAPFALRYERVSGSLPLENTWWNETIDSMAVLGVDFEANKAYLKENLYYAPKKETEEAEPAE
ncbi:MAG: LCP family protein, partial [Lachnospiraceae bacterium]|nr:LCP family protein [Lachnospiraceae bacterium]